MQRNVDSNQDLVHYTDESSSMSSLVHSKFFGAQAKGHDIHTNAYTQADIHLLSP